VSSFLGLLAQLELGAVDARAPVLAAVRSLPALVHRKKVLLCEELDVTLVQGSWRRLVFHSRQLPAGVAQCSGSCQEPQGSVY